MILIAMFDIRNGKKQDSGLNNVLISNATQNEEHGGHSRASRIIGIFTICRRIYPHIFELLQSCDVLIDNIRKINISSIMLL